MNKNVKDKPLIIRINQKHRLGTVNNKLLGGSLNRFYVYTTLALGSAVVHKHTYMIYIFIAIALDEASIPVAVHFSMKTFTSHVI